MESEDNFLVKETRKGDKDAFGKLVDKYKIPVYNLAYRMIGDPTESEDVAQETFLRAYKNLNRFQTEFKFSPWLFQICINICKNINKKRHRHKIISLFLKGDTGNTLGERMMDESVPQEEGLLEKKEETQLLQRAVRGLPHRYQRVIVLRYYEELSYREISQILNISVFTVKTYLYRAREMLRDKLK